ncbi:restriction endonuclease [Actinomadura macrotermitis]|uniref:Restriction endonuclease type IV Mrr domain-containing protein n=1 Tax=Actinomadura macrotermitis TaxID=2585200 RepID=A0A7K0BZF4_9ACTN|nr:restriction endonuclease [Actinomadura macrotermitis]MQY06568.1 hypothetical protein [Actinomadura macrotermitis]
MAEPAPSPPPPESTPPGPTPPGRSAAGAVLFAGGALVLGLLAAAVLVLLGRLVVAYWPQVLTALLFFGVLAGIVVRQRYVARRERRELRERAQLARVDGMSGPEFERLTADLLRRDGYRSVQVVGRAGDRGVDVTAVAPDGRPIAVQCKRWTGRVGAPAVRNLIGAVHSSYAGHTGAIVTSGGFTEPAIAEGTGYLHLIDRAALARWLEGEPLRL